MLIAPLLIVASQGVAVHAPPMNGLDAAEAQRLLKQQPQILAERAPAAFLYYNALGGDEADDAIDDASARPLVIDAQTLAVSPWREHLVRGAQWYLAGGDEHAQPGAMEIAAVLRSHAAVFKADELPQPHALTAMPGDLPEEIYACCGSLALTFTIDGVRHAPPREAMLRLWDERYAQWSEQQAELDRLIAADVDEQLLRVRSEVVAGMDDAAERFAQFLPVVEHGRAHLDAAEFAALMQREIAWHQENSPPWYAMRLRVEAEDDPDAEVIVSARIMRNNLSPSFASVQLGASLVRARLRQGEPVKARGELTSIPGTTHGAAVRVEHFFVLIEASPEIRSAALRLARRTAELCELPQLRRRLMQRLEQAQAQTPE